MPRPKKLNAHLARARLLSASARWNARRAAAKVSPSTVNEQLNVDLCNKSDEGDLCNDNDSSEEMPSDTDHSELENSSSDEDSEEQSDDYTADCDETEAVSTVSTTSHVKIASLSWKEGAGESLKRPFGSGSERTAKRQRQHQRELEKAASSCLDLASVFRRQQELGISSKERRPAIMTRRQAVQHHTKEKRRLALEDCNYKIEGLRETVPASLAHVAHSTILACHDNCLKKMDLYRKGVAYGSGEWKKLTSHQKPYLSGDDR